MSDDIEDRGGGPNGGMEVLLGRIPKLQVLVLSDDTGGDGGESGRLLGPDGGMGTPLGNIPKFQVLGVSLMSGRDLASMKQNSKPMASKSMQNIHDGFLLPSTIVFIVFSTLNTICFKMWFMSL